MWQSVFGGFPMLPSPHIRDTFKRAASSTTLTDDEPASEIQSGRHLASIIERLARAGEQAGFSVEEMIEMLNAGVSIGALLDMISYSSSQEELGFTHRQ